jgi:hypothetical protein
MKKIEEIKLYLFRNAAHYKFETDVLEIFTPELATSLNLSADQTQLTSLYERIGEVFRLNQRAKQTKSIEQLDQERDELFVLFKDVISVHRRSGTAAQKAAAEAVWYVLEPYRKANRETYQENTADLGKAISDLQKPENAVHLTTLGIAQSVADLKTANDAFDVLYKERSDELLGRDELEKGRKLRKEWDEVYKRVIMVITALYYTESNAEKKQTIGLAIDKINALVNQAQKNLKRYGISGGDGSSETPLPTPPADGGSENPGGDENPGGGSDPGTGGSDPGEGDAGSGGPLDRNDIVININE